MSPPMTDPKKYLVLCQDCPANFHGHTGAEAVIRLIEHERAAHPNHAGERRELQLYERVPLQVHYEVLETK